MISACGSSAFSSSRSRQRRLRSTRASSCDAGSPRDGIHAHVERAGALVAEAARRVVDLHRRHAEIGEHRCRAGVSPSAREHLRQAREVPLTRDERRPARSRRRAAAPRSAAVRSDRRRGRSARPPGRTRSRIARAWPPPPSVQSTAISPGARPQASQHFVHHDRPMHARGRLARREDFLHVCGVSLRVQLFVFLVEPAGVLAGISRAPHVGRRRVGRLRQRWRAFLSSFRFPDLSSELCPGRTTTT